MNPRWKIDDATMPGRTFCEHTAYPRLRGELLPFAATPENEDSLPAPNGRCVAKIEWFEDVEEGIHFHCQDMYDSLAIALLEHATAKAQAAELAAAQARTAAAT